MQLQPLCPRTKTMWLIRNLIGVLLLTAATVVLLWLCADNPAFSIVATVLGINWLLQTTLLLIWPTLSYTRYAYGYDDKRLVLQHGVVFRHQITAPLCQIQDLHFYEGPILHLFGLGKIIVSTGGSNFDIIGLDKANAQVIINEIESRLRARIEEQHEEI